MDANGTIVVSGTEDAVIAIREVIDAQSGSQSQMSERRNLDGNVATWIVVANIALTALPHILTFIKDQLASRRVTHIKIGDLEIHNPSPDDLERFRALVAARAKEASDS
jgi:ABC-type sugar transport system ATPase subunit